MKPDPTPRGGPPLRPNPQNPAAARWQRAMHFKFLSEQAAIRQAMWLGACGVAAVFIYLGVTAPDPQAQQPAPTTTTPVTPAAPQPTAPPATPPATPTIPAPAPVEQPPPAAETAEEKTAVELTEADRLAAEPALILCGMESQRETALRRDEDLLKRAADGKAWDAYRALLGRSLKSALGQLTQGRGVNRFDPVWNEPVLYQALLRWKTIGCFSESEITSLVTDSYSAAMFHWLLHQNKAMEELLLTLQPEDDAGKVLQFLMEVWPVNEEKYAKYFSLAVACAVVFDRPMAVPNKVGKEEYGVESMVDPLQRYFWYVKKNEGGKLAAPVHHSSARDLVWAVCAPVTTSELEWSLDKMNLRRNNWGRAYGMVKYLMERAVEGLNPYKEYSFEEILKEGGICGDQSYFCVNTARAQGIPAMIIGGETDLGGHAWAGIKIDDDEWTTAVGRVGGASRGVTGNPQTGKEVTEQEIQSWNDRYHQSPVVTLNVWRHLWIADFFAATGNPQDHAASVHLANNLGHTFVETWRALFDVLQRQSELTGNPPVPKNLEQWKNFAKDMRREFKDNPRMAELAGLAEMEYIFPYGSENDAERTLLRERRRIERQAGEQKDLIASSLKRQAELIHQSGSPDANRDISRLYDRALRDYGGSITGFKMMAEDYFGYLKDDKELARKAARDIELAFKRVVETGTKDWFRANTEAGIYQMICGYYRTAGDSDRAELLEKRYQVLLRRSKRSAL